LKVNIFQEFSEAAKQKYDGASRCMGHVCSPVANGSPCKNIKRSFLKKRW
jgi:hypothetical protein